MTVKYATRDLKELRITPDIEAAAEKKMARRLRKYLSGDGGQGQAVTVRVAEEKPRIRVGIDMSYQNSRISAEAEATNSEGILGGIEKCLDIIDKQVEKFRTKLLDKSGESIRKGEEEVDIDEDDEEDEIEE